MHQLQRNSAGGGGLTEINLGVRTSVIDYSTSRALNARADQGSLQDILETNEAGICIISDADEELIFSIAFKDSTTITSCQFYCPETPDDKTSPPKLIEFYSNLDAIDFEEVTDIQSAQTVTITPEDLKNADYRIPMKGTKFQKCNSIQIYIASNQGNTPMTCLSGLRLYGFVCPPYTQGYMRS